MLDFYKAIWKATGPRQAINIFLALGIAVLAAFPLNYQKLIINGLTEETLSDYQLFTLCVAMSGIILISLVLKWVLGYLSSAIGEEAIRKLRYRICGLSSQKNAETPAVSSGAKAAMVSSEAEVVGKFAGSAISEPLVQGGTLVAIVGYIVANQPLLGLIAIVIIVPQVIIVLVAQGSVNTFVKGRVYLLREASNLLTDPDSSTSPHEITDKFDLILDTRKRIFVWKLSSKFLLSAINAAGIVGVLLIGGWEVLEGKSDVGTVVAATVGLTRLQGPIKQIIAFYRQLSAVVVKFRLLDEVNVFMNDPVAQPAPR